MKATIGVVLADSSGDYLTMLSELINKESDIAVLGTARNGCDAVSLVHEEKPDVLVLDTLLRHLDGIGVLRRLKACREMPRVIVVSAFINDGIAAELSRLGVDYCFPKPCSVGELISRIRGCVPVRRMQLMPDDIYNRQISHALKSFGVLPHLQGYRYLREAVRHSLADPSLLRGVTKVLYPELARQFHTTPKCVERSMRNAIQAAARAPHAQRRQYFGDALEDLCERPSNSRFIAFIVEFILSGGNYACCGELSCSEEVL